MEIIVKAWGDVVAKIKNENGINHFSLSPNNKLKFSPIKLKEKGVDYDFSHLAFQKGLPGMISDSLPGVYGKEYLDEFFVKHLNFKPSYLETLQFLGENTMGALTYSPMLKGLKKAKKDRTNAIFDAVGLYEETKKALMGDADFSINEIIALSNSAASGARPKAIVGFNKETKKMFVGPKYESLPDGFVHSIVKFDNLIYKDILKDITEKEKASQTKGEYIYYLVAKELGIKMADSHLVEAQGNCHFITERFDVSAKDGVVTRKHMHSLSGLMHHNPAETSFDYVNLFRSGGLLNIPHEDKEQFFKTMLFNLIYGNRDDHSRNFSYLMDSNGAWRGAPAYDLTFSTNRKHQMLFDYTSGYDLNRKHIKKIADTFRIKGSDEMIEQMMDLKHSLLDDLATQYDMKEWYSQIIKSTSYALED